MININELPLIKITNKVDAIRNRIIVETTQQYENNTEEALDIKYIFPLPDEAAVFKFIVKIGDEIYEGKIEENKEAEKKYNEASAAGDTATMVTKENNSFIFCISNVPANMKFEITLSYAYGIVAKSGKYTINIPTTLAPQYGNMNQLMMGLNIPENNKTVKTSTATHKVSFDIKLHNAKNVKITSDHDLKIEEKEKYTSVTGNNIIPNRDLVLSYELDNNSYILKANNGNEQYTYLSYYNEEEDIVHSNPGNYIFLIDTSGSMSGIKLNKTKNMLKLCIDNLQPGDKYKILLFNNNVEAIGDKEFYDYSDEKNKAFNFEEIDKITAIGGTNILGALNTYIHKDDLTILLFTDGQVYNCEEIYKTIRNKGDNTRLFTFGIDDAINVNFINKMAEIGDGRSEFLTSSEDFFEKTMDQIVCIKNSPNKLLITTKSEEVIKNVYSNDGAIYITNENIKNLKLLKENDEVEINLETIEDNNYFEMLKIYYYYNLIKNKSLPKERIIKYSKESNIMTEYTSFLLIKTNDEKVHATAENKISGMMPTSWEDTSTYCCRALYTPSISQDCFVNSAQSMQIPQKFCSYSRSLAKQSNMNPAGMPTIGSIKKSKAIAENNFTDKTITKKQLKKKFKELLEIQQKDGGIYFPFEKDCKEIIIQKTKEFIELYEKLGRPKKYEKQYKMATQFLKNNK